MDNVPVPVVGIIANPVSARDIRRIVSHAGSLQITDRANIVLRILAGLAAAGVTDVVMMPENAGIRVHLNRAMMRARNAGEARFPALDFLQMNVTGQAEDSAHAARLMRRMGVAAIVVLGGDGTHRVVVSGCGGVPIAGVSTGTNNAFPEHREPTITGLAVGLAVTGAVPPGVAFAGNKRFDVTINDSREIALVDVCVMSERFIGSRAIWKAEGFRELFVTFAEPGAIGMSSIVGLLAPVKRSSPFGRRVILEPPGAAPFRLMAPIAPGLIEPVGIQRLETVSFDAPVTLTVPAGSLAFDGEREVTFSERDSVSVTLRDAAFRTVDVSACMAHAAAKGRLVEPAGTLSLLTQQQGGSS
jgi:predicted polyphosphate/ATP-dependent NAD kinase